MAQDLTLGSKAPKLAVKKFIKGDAVKGFDKDKIYVVEFWATWCGPCRATIPHLTKLQKQYKEVTFIGVAILEEDQDKVGEFVEKMGDEMDYRVALDQVPEDGEGSDGAMVKNWMEPAELSGIPASFIVNGDGVIAWIGHPGQIDDPLEQIVAGKWDVAAEAKKAKALAAERKKLEAVFTKLRTLFGEFNDSGDSADLLKELDAAAKEVPARATQFSMIKFQVLASPKGNVDQALELGGQLLETEEIGENAEALNNVAWMLVDPEREKKADPKLLKFALKVAIKADNLKKNQDPSIADTLAKAYFDNGQLEKAVATQERVIELLPGTELEDDPGVKKRMRQYKRALEASKSDDAPKK
jgi:thiol-disulfide isomerase/thioredoxin